MAQRIDLSELSTGGGLPGAPLGQLGALFAAPGLNYMDMGGHGNSYGMESMDLTKMGSEELMLPEWSTLWNQNTGTVQDPFALFRYLNIANIMGPESELLKGSGTSKHASEYRSPAYAGHGGGYDPYVQSARETGNWEGALKEWLYNLRYGGYDAGEHTFGGVGYAQKRGDIAPSYYDPANLRFTDMPGNYAAMSQGDWDSWAREQGGKNLWDLVSRPQALIDEEALWRSNPSMWFNGMDPVTPQRMLGEGSGLGSELGSARMEKFGESMANWWDRQQNMRALGPNLFMANALRNDPGFARSGLGQYHGAVAPGQSQMNQLMGGFAPQAGNYQYLIQAAMQPYLMQQKLGDYFRRSMG